MPLTRTIIFWLGGFVLLTILFAWSDSLRHARLWTWSRSGASQTQVKNGQGELSFTHRHIQTASRTGDPPYPPTPFAGEIQSAKKEGSFRFGDLGFERSEVDGSTLVPPLGYRAHSLMLTLPHWMLAVIFLPLWLTASAWRAVIFRRRLDASFQRTRSHHTP